MQMLKPESSLTRFSDLVHLIYGAAAEPRRWPEVVEALARDLQSKQGLLFTPNNGPDGGGLMFPWGVSEEDLVLWGTKFIDHDIWTQAGHRKGLFHDGAVVLDDELVTQDEFLTSVYYREFLSKMGVSRLCTGVIFAGAPGLPATIVSFCRGPEDPPYGETERDWVRLLMPHLSRALGLMHRLSLARHQVASMHSALDRLSVGVLLLNQQLAVIHANTAAQNVLARGDGLAQDVQRKLVASGVKGGKTLRLEHWLQQLVALPALERGGFNDNFEVARRKPARGESGGSGSAGATYSVQCCPLEPIDLLASTEGASHVVFVTDPRKLELPTVAQLSQQLGLTPAEARVAMVLAEGRTYQEVAETLGISEETVRSHVKAIYPKTRTQTKVALTRLILSLAKAGV